MGQARRVVSLFIKKDYSFFLQSLSPGLVSAAVAKDNSLPDRK